MNAYRSPAFAARAESESYDDRYARLYANLTSDHATLLNDFIAEHRRYVERPGWTNEGARALCDRMLAVSAAMRDGFMRDVKRHGHVLGKDEA